MTEVPSEAVLQSTLRTTVNAVETIHTSAVINANFFLCNLYAMRLAFTLTGMTAHALTGVNHGAEHCKAGEET